MRLISFLIFICGISLANAKEIPQRIVSIGGAITETIYELGEQSKIIGSDTTSYYPKEANNLPKVGYQRALSSEGILSLNPDLIICTDEAGPQSVIKQLKQSHVEILTLKSANNITEVIENIRIIGNRLGIEKKSENLINKINLQIIELEKKKKNISSKARIMFILQHGGGSMMIAGNNTAADGIIKMAGLTNVASKYNGYKILTSEAVIFYAPDIILVTTNGLEDQRKQSDFLQQFGKVPALVTTPAFKNNKIIVMDSLLLLGFGPRTPQAATLLFEQSKK